MADPVYRQIADDLRLKIETGEMPAGTQLPTELELREQYQNASRNTVRDAIKWLTNRGLVRTQPGRGTFVVDKIDPFIVDLTPGLEFPGLGGREEIEYGSTYARDVRSVGRQPRSSTPSVEMKNAQRSVAIALGLEPGAQVVCRQQERYVDNRPFSMQTTYYPFRFLEKGATLLIQAQDIEGGAMSYLAKLLGIREAGYEDRILVRPPLDSEVRFFGIGGHVLIMETDRVTFDEEGQPLRYTATVYPSDRNEFVIRAGELPRVETD